MARTRVQPTRKPPFTARGLSQEDFIILHSLFSYFPLPERGIKIDRKRNNNTIYILFSNQPTNQPKPSPKKKKKKEKGKLIF
jgi:hypothetical protein